MNSADRLAAVIRGNVFEVFIRILLEKNGWQIQQRGDPDKYRDKGSFWIELKGRGTWHQIDGPCLFEKPIPFIYPLRLIAEMKFLKGKKGEVQKKHIREFVGVVKDISENYFVDDNHTTDSQERFTDVGTFFSANGFQREAVNLGFAHGIRTVSYRTNANVADIKNGIEKLIKHGFPSRNVIHGKGKLAAFKKNLYDYMTLSRAAQLNTLDDSQFIELNGVRRLLNDLREKLNGIRSSFLGTTSSGVLLHFIGTDEFPDDLFIRTDTQFCRIYYGPSTETGIPMWLEFSEDSEGRRFYFDVPPGLEEVIKNEGDVLGEKERHFAYVAVYKRIRGLMRLLTFELDKNWIDNLRGRKRG